MMRTRQPRRLFKIRLRKGDMVVVTRGRLKGQKGRVTATHPYLNQVSIEGVNIVKKHLKPSRSQPQGGIIELNRPLAVSKVAPLEPKLQKPSRIGFKLAKDGTKERFYKRGGALLKTALPIAKPTKKKAEKTQKREKKEKQDG